MTTNLQSTYPARRGVPLVVAHRGWSARFPENTGLAFREAMALGADAVELDVRATADGVFVCGHDDAVKTTPPGGPLISGTTRASLEAHEVGGWKSDRFRGEAVPTLEEALSIIAWPCIPVVERKAGEPEALLKALDDAGAVERVVVIAFDWIFLGRLRALNDRICLGVLGKGQIDPGAVVEVCHDLNAAVLDWHKDHLTPLLVAACREAGIACWSWTVNEEDHMRHALGLGLDGITTDHPDRLLAMTRGWEEAPPGPRVTEA